MVSKSPNWDALPSSITPRCSSGDGCLRVSAEAVDLLQSMDASWPPLTDFPASVGRLAIDDDIRAGRATFLLQSEGERIGNPIPMELPVYAWFVDADSGERKRCVIIQAEQADDIRYYGARLIDTDEPLVGFESDFEILKSAPL